MNKEKFIEYLDKLDLKGRSASDILSRCRLIERKMNIDLDYKLKPELKSLDNILSDLEEHKAMLIKTGKAIYAINNLKTALRHYYRFLLSKEDSKP